MTKIKARTTKLKKKNLNSDLVSSLKCKNINY